MTDSLDRTDESAVDQNTQESPSSADEQVELGMDFRGHSETGPVRRNNQDSAYVSPTMLCVADGMGGAAAGDLASTVAIDELRRSDAEYEPDELLEVLAGAMSRANDKLADLITADPALDGMGTTVCGAMYSQGLLQMVHIGDSRAYLLRDGQLTRLTHDDSWVQSLVDDGRITEAEAAVHPHRSLLLKVLNGQPNYDPDYPTLTLRLGDRLLFCSDGLCGLVSDEQLHELMTDTTLDETVQHLVDAARMAGGYDNITLILADAVSFDPQLATRTPQILGAAAQVEIPKLSSIENTATQPAVSLPEGDTAAATQASLSESALAEEPDDALGDGQSCYIPTAGRRRRWPWITASLLALLIIAGAAFGFYRHITNQFYIAPEGEHIAIYKGLPESVLGVKLGSRVEQRTTKISDLPHYYADQVRNHSIHADSLNQAREQASYLEQRASSCITARKKPTQASPSATATPANSPGTSSAPQNSAEPEECR